jgi:Ribbon-helix-helix protein, copG family
MKRIRENGKTRKKDIIPAVRASISFPPDLYEALEELAKQKKVSLAWVVRDAAEKYAVSEAKEGRGRPPAGPEN